MTRRFINTLSDGDTFEEVWLVGSKQVRSNRNGNRYLQLELDDRTGSLDAIYWNASDADAAAFGVGDFIAVKGRVQLFQGNLQAIVSGFRRCDAETVDLADFLPATDKNVEALLAELRRQLDAVANPYLQAIARAFLMDEGFMRRFSQAPAGIKNHHAYLSGLLEHVVNLMTAYERIADLYPDLDQDLMRMGIFLHDIGKTRELAFERVFAYRDEGQLIGHVVIGVEMLNEKLRLAVDLLGEPIPEVLILQLKHLILSHHGAYEFGSPKLPMTPEAVALHHLDNLDAKVHNFAQTIRTDLSADSNWTPYDPKLGRKLYKAPGANNGAATDSS
jgi:3'-5' exoribonuclease